jgi:hypothetical protein
MLPPEHRDRLYIQQSIQHPSSLWSLFYQDKSLYRRQDAVPKVHYAKDNEARQNSSTK